MSASSKPKAKFEIQVDGRWTEQTRVTVFDGLDREVASGDGEVKKMLPPGLYTVRLDRGSRTVEHVVRHEGTTSELIQAPGRHSSLPVFDTSQQHEYYAYTSRDWSRQFTRSPILGSAARLFVFVRAVSERHYQQSKGGKNLAQGLSLLTHRGRVVSKFGPSEVEHNEMGWMALSAKARPGIYYLVHKGRRPRMMPIHVFPRWNTQVFLTHHHWPHLATASILMPSIHDGFNPDDKVAYAVDMALSSLAEGENYVPRSLMNDLLYGKFHNPMRGLLSAYLLLLTKEGTEEHRRLSSDRVERIIHNIEGLIPRSPDVQALKLLAEERLKERWHEKIRPMTDPPMLRVGLEAMVRASRRRRGIVPERSLSEAVSINHYVDSAWTMWRSTRIEPSKAKEDRQAKWVQKYIRQETSRRKKRGGAIDLRQIAAGARAPLELVERAYESMGAPDLAPNVDKDDLTDIKGISGKYDEILKRLGYRTYEDIANLEKSDFIRLAEQIGRSSLAGNINKWVKQAKKLKKLSDIESDS